MTVKIFKTTLQLPQFEVNALAFLPSTEAGAAPIRHQWGLFTHGYTSHKGDCIPWASRLAEAGMPCLIFDLPGHFLGSFQEVDSLEDFQQHAHRLFIKAWQKLDEFLQYHYPMGVYPSCQTMVIGGHSLGALLSLKALELAEMQAFQKLAIGIGIGIGQHKSTHIFETAFYQKTLTIRRQLVSTHLDSNDVFKWIKEEKQNFQFTGQKLHFITGEDDIVVGAAGLTALCEDLKLKGNDVTWYEPKRMPHHEPGLAATHIYAFLKEHFRW